MDDVLARFDLGFLSIYNEKYQDSLCPDDMFTWDMTQYVKKECGKSVYELLKHPGLFRYLQPTEHSQKVIERLHHAGFLILIVSDSPRGHSHDEALEQYSTNPADDKRAWLEEHFPMIPQNCIFFGSQKMFVTGDVLIDDKPETFHYHENIGMECILIDRPYNRDFETTKRAFNLLEAEKMIYDMFLK
jgi:5'(3')-deoxyribonucleotidase